MNQNCIDKGGLPFISFVDGGDCFTYDFQNFSEENSTDAGELDELQRKLDQARQVRRRAEALVAQYKAREAKAREEDEKLAQEMADLVNF